MTDGPMDRQTDEQTSTKVQTLGALVPVELYVYFIKL